LHFVTLPLRRHAARLERRRYCYSRQRAYAVCCRFHVRIFFACCHADFLISFTIFAIFFRFRRHDAFR